jgi:hypothetical protein
MLRQKPVGLQYIITGERIEPGGDAQAVIVLNCGAGSSQEPVVSGLRKQGRDLLNPCVNQETVGFEILATTVVAALAFGKFLEEILVNASAL